MASLLVKEDAGQLLLESGAGALLLEVQPVETGNYLVQEIDSTGRFELESGTGFILLEAASAAPVSTGVQGGIIIPRRRLVTRLRREELEEDEAIALSLLLRTRKRLR